MRLPTLHLPSWPAPPLFIFLYGDDDDDGCSFLFFYRDDNDGSGHKRSNFNLEIFVRFLPLAVVINYNFWSVHTFFDKKVPVMRPKLPFLA